MRKKGAFSSEMYKATAEVARSEGTATFRGEQLAREGKGLDHLVDPKSSGSAREAMNLLIEQPDHRFLLEAGIAMPLSTDFDTTGSMGHNIDKVFAVLPRVHDLVVQNTLARYHVAIATGVVQDICDQFPYQRSQFEPDNEIDHQMTLLVPEHGGGDNTEDYQLGLYYTAHRVRTSIVGYGLKGYYFLVGDERGRDSLNPADASKFLGVNDLQSRISVQELGRQVLKNWHAFFLQIGDTGYVTDYWSSILGRERVIITPRTEDIAEIQAVVTGLTEGILDLQSAVSFLVDTARLSSEAARRIVRAVNHIPLRAQADLPGFDRIPPKGSTFASREDIWPIDDAAGEDGHATKPIATDDDNEIDWEL